MADQKMRFSLKSEELRGATQPNILYVVTQSAADAWTLADALETSFAADVVTVDEMLSEDYTLPYPTGTNKEWRFAFRNAGYQLEIERIWNVSTTYSDDTFLTALSPGDTCKQLLVPKGYALDDTLTPVASCEITRFSPGKSV